MFEDYTERFRAVGNISTYIFKNVRSEEEVINFFEKLKNAPNPLRMTEILWLLQDEFFYSRYHDKIKAVLDCHNLTNDYLEAARLRRRHLSRKKSPEVRAFRDYLASIIESVRSMNKQLCDLYPFLRLRLADGKLFPKYCRYDSTYLDWMPYGWRVSFGLAACEQLRNILLESNYLEDYRVFDIKEKYGTLRWYDQGVPQSCYDATQKVIDETEDRSFDVCPICGKKAVVQTKGWIGQYCKDCVPVNSKYSYIADRNSYRWYECDEQGNESEF